MNLDYEPWKLVVVIVLFLGVLYGLAPYFADVERKRARDKPKK